MKKYILSLLCLTQFMVSANNDNKSTDFLCNKPAEEQQEKTQEENIKTTYQEINKQPSNNNFEESKEKTKRIILSGVIGITLGLAVAIIDDLQNLMYLNQL